MPDSRQTAALNSADPAAGLDARQQLACCLRLLSQVGWNENFAGHITWQEPGSDTMWCNPAGLWWNEVSASDICRVDFKGHVVDGTRGVTEAIFIHTELHRRRDDARVVVHGHPYYATLLSAIPLPPRITHQAGCLFDGELGVVAEYDGGVTDVSAGQHLADGVGESSGVIMANHGALVTAGTPALATFRAVTFERMCQATVDLIKMGAEAQEIAPRFRASNARWLQDKGVREYWSGAVRQLVSQDPSVLD